MKKINNVTIGISTYGPLPRSQYLIQSIKRNMDDRGDLNVNIVLCDDGTQSSQLDDRRRFCKKEGVTLLENGINKGIPFVWNRLIAESTNADALVIFSDGIRVLQSGWLSRLAYFLDKNERVGTVGLPHVSDPSLYDPNEDRYTANPGRVGSAVGCSFIARPEVLLQIENPDGSRGYWNALLGFHEEISMGLLLCEKGFLSYMISYPGNFYRGGMAFNAHSELIWRTEDPYLPKDEFIYWVQQSKWFVPQYMELYEKGSFDKMSYSRIMFCKRFGNLEECKAGRRFQEIKNETVDVLDDPPKFTHPKVCDIWEPRRVYFLDRDGREQSCMDA